MITTDLLLCPICRAPVTRPDNNTSTLACPQRHSFDIASEGYINLLRKKLPGDTREMLQARRAFFEREHYRPLSDALNELIAAHLPLTYPSSLLPTSPITLLDAGCGEGYYLQRLQTALHAQQHATAGIGLDISKEAAKMAARRYRDALFLVANLKEPLPLQDAAFHALLNIFAPRNPPEFARVLMPDGLLLIVIPGPTHLQELRATLHLLNIEEHKQQHVIEQFTDRFTLLTTRRITYELHLRDNEITQAVLMTPNYWHLAEETRQALATMTELRTTVEFVCLLFRHANR
jgi:23S rRNA (guanine745-N1)-methyltransferase